MGGRRQGGGKGKPRTTIERIMNHFNVSREEAEKNFEEYKEKLPPRGTGRKR